MTADSSCASAEERLAVITDHAGSSPQDLYRTIRLIRRFEERAIELVRSGEIVSGIHPCIGQEAVAAGHRRRAAPRRRHDGQPPRRTVTCWPRAAIPGGCWPRWRAAPTGVARGRGGSFHPSDFSVGVFGCDRDGRPRRADRRGRRVGARRKGTDRIAIGIFGDGAVNQGALLESFNLARCGGLPVVFVCENNLYATTRAGRPTRSPARSPAGRPPSGSRPSSCDGMDPDIVLRGDRGGGGRARAGGGPSFLEFLTYRYEGHHTFELKAGLRYRDPAEVAAWRPGTRSRCRPAGSRKSVRRRIDDEVETVVRRGRTRVRASASPRRGRPRTGARSRDYLLRRPGPRRSSRRDGPMPALSYLRAINRALGDEMERDPTVFVMGEDVQQALTNTTVGLLVPVRPAAGGGDAAVGAGIHRLRDRRRPGRPAAGGGVPDPVPAAAGRSSRSPTRRTRSR